MSTPSKQTAWERWELGSFDENQAASPDPTEADDAAAMMLPTAARVEEIHQQAYDEGFKQGLSEGKQQGHSEGKQQGHTEGLQQGKKEGYADGLEQGKGQVEAEAQRLSQAIAGFDAAFGQLEEAVADELLALSVELARQVVAQELQAQPNILLNIVRQALAQVPHQHASIFLHPEDASLLRSYMGEQLSHVGHRIHEDAKLKRGDCVLEAGGTHIDGGIAMRWQRVLENLGIESAWQPVSASTATKTAAAADAATAEAQAATATATNDSKVTGDTAAAKDGGPDES